MKETPRRQFPIPTASAARRGVSLLRLLPPEGGFFRLHDNDSTRTFTKKDQQSNNFSYLKEY
jgi:hypothetical protein